MDTNGTSPGPCGAALSLMERANAWSNRAIYAQFLLSIRRGATVWGDLTAQAAAGLQAALSRTMALRTTTSRRMQATRATFFFLPRAR